MKANVIANKAVSTLYGYPNMAKKGDMTPEMLSDRQELQDEISNGESILGTGKVAIGDGCFLIYD